MQIGVKFASKPFPKAVFEAILFFVPGFVPSPKTQIFQEVIHHLQAAIKETQEWEEWVNKKRTWSSRSG